MKYSFRFGYTISKWTHTLCMLAGVNFWTVDYVSKQRKPCLKRGYHCRHWRSSHYAVTHVHNKNSNIQERSPNVVKSDIPYHKELLLKERIRFLWGQILSFKRSSHFEKGCNWREALLDPVVSLWCAYLFKRSGYTIGHIFFPLKVACCLHILLVCAEVLHCIQQFFSHVGTFSCLPGLDQY